jgi:hypothetical protein
MHDITKSELLFEIESLQSQPDIDIDALWQLLNRIGKIEAEPDRIVMYAVARKHLRGRVMHDLLVQHRSMTTRRYLEAASK